MRHCIMSNIFLLHLQRGKKALTKLQSTFLRVKILKYHGIFYLGFLSLTLVVQRIAGETREPSLFCLPSPHAKHVVN